MHVVRVRASRWRRACRGPWASHLPRGEGVAERRVAPHGCASPKHTLLVASVIVLASSLPLSPRATFLRRELLLLQHGQDDGGPAVSQAAVPDGRARRGHARRCVGLDDRQHYALCLQTVPAMYPVSCTACWCCRRPPPQQRLHLKSQKSSRGSQRRARGTRTPWHSSAGCPRSTLGAHISSVKVTTTATSHAGGADEHIAGAP